MDFKDAMKILERTLLGPEELNLIVDKVNETKGLPGYMAEVGMFRGGSSLLIALTDSDRGLLSFDSFEGLPEGIVGLDKLPKGEFRSNEKEVRELFQPHRHVIVNKGWFPQDFPWAKSLLYSFVHIDVDHYQSTLDCLKFFYPRMPKGGVLISDDYEWPDCPGVKKAFTEFMADKPETLVSTDFFTCYFKKN